MYSIVVLDCDLKDILRRIAMENIINKGEMVKLIRDIEDKDRTFIKGANDILGEYK